eukprot:sb/3475245/
MWISPPSKRSAAVHAMDAHDQELCTTYTFHHHGVMGEEYTGSESEHLDTCPNGEREIERGRERKIWRHSHLVRSPHMCVGITPGAYVTNATVCSDGVAAEDRSKEGFFKKSVYLDPGECSLSTAQSLV